MNEALFLNFIFAFVILMIGLMFLEGVWHKKGKVIKNFLDVDDYFFPNLKDKRILKAGDQLAFIICLFMAVFTFINGLIVHFLKSVPNISLIFILVAVFMVWPIRIIFISIYRNSRHEEVPRIWPFRKVEKG